MISKHVIIAKFMDICKVMIHKHVGVSELEKFIVYRKLFKKHKFKYNSFKEKIMVLYISSS